MVVSIIICVLLIVANWKIFKKMGTEGWYSIIPLLNTYVLFDKLYGNGWKMLLLLIPFYNIYVSIKFCIDLAHAFGKSSGFAVGLIFLSPIFTLILGFSEAKFTSPVEA